jgi:hypothetical protein
VRVAVFAVGRRVYVAGEGDRSARATLTDEAGKTPLESLGDGTEVAILAWRPASAGATRYRVRATDSGLEGWLPVANLRGTKVAVAAPAKADTPPLAHPAAPRFGDYGGTRFGQRKGGR